ncbi:vWA domain-containing protein [Tumebacillus permanentifrigoris]|uniref:Putative membrane protein (TIGR02226 family) n=1 Tax=Tumebacillus permanentifrigoris TaxID=378543 RepID=A0A316DUT4_9BACL|nr:VWA domain-containing protein [Tumebacillus permanentifrigoris]PWK12832.1 putative membrane protein (TIGR02226 family) [Tumebacillus permanentifrigoris]
MNFLSPYMLFWLATLPAIVALYLLKRTYENQTVPSVLLWQKLLREMEANTPWQKLRRNLLLLLQLVLAALLALALARPALTSFQGASADHTIAVLDLSPSMAVVTGTSGSQTALDSAKTQISDLLNHLSPNQRLTLISMGREARVLASSNDRAELQRALDQATQEYGKADYESALSLAAALSTQEPTSDVRIYSDGNWGLDPKLYPHFGRPPQLLQPQPRGKNASIRHAAAVDTGGHTALVATVENLSDEVNSLDVQIQAADGTILQANSTLLKAKEQIALSWSDLPSSDFYRVMIEGTDALAADNLWIVLPERTTTAKAWLVTASNQGNVFLEKALSLGNRLSVERGTDVESPPKDAALYIYEGVLPKEWPTGSVLVVNPPADSTLLPTGASVEAGKLQVLKPDAALLQNVDLTNLHLQTVQPLRGAPWLEPLVKSGDTPILLTGEQGGRRYAVLSFDLHQSDLPLLPAFPILVKHLREYLLPTAGSTLGQVEVGERMALLPPIRENGWTYTDPAGGAHDITQEVIEQGFRPTEPGLYKFQSKDGNAQQLLSATVPASESVVTPTLVSLPSVGRSEQAPAAADPVGGLEIWRYLAALILLLLFVEWGVYKRGI